MEVTVLKGRGSDVQKFATTSSRSAAYATATWYICLPRARAATATVKCTVTIADKAIAHQRMANRWQKVPNAVERAYNRLVP